jgi:hypothetical protein
MIVWAPLLAKQQLQQIESSETRFLRSVAGYGRTDENRNVDVSQEVNAVT